MDLVSVSGEERVWIADLYFSWWLRPGKTRTLTVGGFNRKYLVHAPKGHDLKTPLPVVLALHGATMNGPMMAWFSGLNRKADEAGFIAVYPNGTGTHGRVSERTKVSVSSYSSACRMRASSWCGPRPGPRTA